MDKREIQKKAEWTRKIGHLLVDGSSISALLLGLGRWAYDYFISKDVAFGNEALALGVVSAILIYVVGHPVTEIQYREDLENRN